MTLTEGSYSDNTSQQEQRTADRPRQLLGLTAHQIGLLVAEELGEPLYRGQQISNWIYTHGVLDFGRMTNLNGGLRDRLAERFQLDIDAPDTIQKSPDGTQKLLFRKGSDVWESVLMRDGERRTVCVSTQSGCGLGCRFCATAKLGFLRNLTPPEIIGQIMRAGELLPENERVTNVVFMGMGEPLQNYDAVKAVLDVIASTSGMEVSIRKTTVSTVGLVPQIRRWAQDRIKAHLAISLIAADDAIRSDLMPINRRYPLAELKAAAIEVTESTRQRVTFEYILMDGVNDSVDNARKLVSFIHGIPCKINLIRFHPHPGSEFRPPTEERVLAFRDYLYPRAPAVSIRKSFGVDIDAACGQLAGRNRM
jgi:23S rRNA (adenine2503-C2)-methyltransferase